MKKFLMLRVMETQQLMLEEQEIGRSKMNGYADTTNSGLRRRSVDDDFCKGESSSNESINNYDYDFKKKQQSFLRCPQDMNKYTSNNTFAHSLDPPSMPAESDQSADSESVASSSSHYH